jgi:hypothetical protein
MAINQIIICHNYKEMGQQVATPMGFFNVQDPLMCWKQQQQSSSAAVPMHLVNKSSSSSCIYAKTLSQPTHLAKNYDIFAKYKPIVSDDEDSESDDEDESKHSNISKGSSYVSINKMSSIVPAPPVVPFMRPSYHEKQKSGNYLNQYPPPFTKLNSIPIHSINGQLPSAFKKSNNNNCDPIAKSSMNDVVVGEASRKNSLNSNSNKMTQQQVMKYSCNSSSRENNSDNIFFNFLNPMAATKPEMHFQQQETSSNESVGCSYTPYTKYLSDRKYFDVAAMSDVNGTNNQKPEQRRSSKIPILSSTTTTQAEQLQNLNISSSEHILPSGDDVMLHDDAVVEGCDESKVDKKTEEFQLENVANVEPTNVNTNANLNNETFVVDPKEILSAFDPYFIDDTKQPIMEPSNNKLHKLLSAVASEWNSNSNCDIVRQPPPSTSSYTSHKHLLTKCKSFQSTPHFGCQYEVVKISFIL